MAEETRRANNELGVWVRFWDLAVAFALLLAAFAYRQDSVNHLRGLPDAADKAYFAGKPVLLDSYRSGYSFETVRDHLRALGAKGREFYAHDFMPITDLAATLFLMTFLILFILYATQSDKYHALGLPSWVRILLLLPPIAQFLFDVGENYLLRSLIADFPRLHPPSIETASLLTSLKWIAIFVNTLIVVGLGGYTFYQWIARPEQKA